MQSIIFYSIVLACMYLSWGMIGLYVAGGYIAISLLRSLYLQIFFEELKIKVDTANMESDDYQNQPSVWAQKQIDSMSKGVLSLPTIIFWTAIFMLPYYGFWSYVVCIFMLPLVLGDLFHSCIYACMWMKHVTYKNNVLKTMVDSMITMSYYSALYSLYYGGMYYILTLSFGIAGLYVCVASGIAECINYVMPKYKLEDVVTYFKEIQEISFYDLDVAKFELAFDALFPFLLFSLLLAIMCTPYNGVFLYIATVCLTATAVGEMRSAIYWTIYNIRKNVLRILEHRGHGDYSYGIFKSFIFSCTFIGSAYFLLHLFGYNACYILVPYAIFKYMYGIQYNKNSMQHVSIMLVLFTESCQGIYNSIINMEKGDNFFSKLCGEIYSYRIVMRMLPIMNTYLVYLVIMPITAWCVLPMIMQCGFLPYYIAGILIVAFIIADMLMSSLQLMVVKELSFGFENNIEIEDKVTKSKFYNEMKKSHQPRLISFIHYLNFIKQELSPRLNIDTVIDDILDHKIESVPQVVDVYCRGSKNVITAKGTVSRGLRENSSQQGYLEVLEFMPTPSKSSEEIRGSVVSPTQSTNYGNANTAGGNSLFSTPPSNEVLFEDSDSNYSRINAID